MAGTLRLRLARSALNASNRLSRRLHLGAGTVAGGRIGLAIAPQLLERLAESRTVAIVSGTNGKTTTTALLAAAAHRRWPIVVTNATGSNMPAGHVAALASGPPGAPAILEVDEGYVPGLLSATAPEVAVLLNLSRDQLDRTNEVRMVAGRWRQAFEHGETTVVANCDDPLVVFGAQLASRVVWVAAGMRWRADATGCPVCGGRIEFDASTWHCSCGFGRPQPAVEVHELADGTSVVHFQGAQPVAFSLALPGLFNRSNALMAAGAARALGIDPGAAVAAMATVKVVAGRFSVVSVGGQATRLMLAKNPAGWSELLGLVSAGTAPLVVGINARVADGRDPSWLWDVPFEQLAGRQVVATGERSADLSVRLHYAGVEHLRERDSQQAVHEAASASGDSGTVPVDFIGNYTAFSDLRRSSHALTDR
jgi:lipid II isoglutaminyl synthase (glutamine-hydrolysing)